VNTDTGARLKIFLSYARADRAWAQQLIRALESAMPAPQRFEIWWDALLEGGENFLPSTEAALEGADVVMVLWSATSVASHWVRDEATSGRDRRRLVPISIDGIMPPLGFRQFQVIDMAGWQGVSDALLARVISAVHSVAGTAPPPAAITLASATASPLPGQTVKAAGINRRLLLAGGGAVLTAGAGVLGWRQFGRDTNADTVAATAANSIAVLPFRNLSGDAGQDYFAEGLAEELRTTLSLNRQLLVSGQVRRAASAPPRWTPARSHAPLASPTCCRAPSGNRPAACGYRPGWWMAPAALNAGPRRLTGRSPMCSPCRPKSPPSWPMRWSPLWREILTGGPNGPAAPAMPAPSMPM
jgi:hypothetical protein